MARIRIVDEWLRSPVSAPARQRAIMVVARSWAEQRVLMRAFAASDDQTRPTINLHGAELAIGPAGTDPHGEWGIHVEPPVDGRAQELREALHLAARLLAGSKGNPARLQDENSAFDDKATNMWAPGTAPSPESGEKAGKRTVFGHSGASAAGYYEPAEGAPKSSSKVIPSSAAARSKIAKSSLRKTPPFWGNTYDSPELEKPAAGKEQVLKSQPSASVPPARFAPLSRRSKRQTFRYSGAVAAQKPAPRPKKQAAKTVHGFSPAASAGSGESYASIAGKTMPLGLTLEDGERLVLNTLGQKPFLSAAEIGELLGISEPMVWMARFLDKLAEFGLDLVAPGDDLNGEPTYVLVR